jgi:hypothetical protein
MVSALTIATHVALNKYKTHFSIGFMIGATSMISQFFLMLGVLFADIANDFRGRRLASADREQFDSANEMMAVISFFLFATYVSFGIQFCGLLTSPTRNSQHLFFFKGGFSFLQIRNRASAMTN